MPDQGGGCFRATCVGTLGRAATTTGEHLPGNLLIVQAMVVAVRVAGRAGALVTMPLCRFGQDLATASDGVGFFAPLLAGGGGTKRKGARRCAWYFQQALVDVARVPLL